MRMDGNDILICSCLKANGLILFGSISVSGVNELRSFRPECVEIEEFRVVGEKLILNAFLLLGLIGKFKTTNLE